MQKYEIFGRKNDIFIKKPLSVNFYLPIGNKN